MASRPASRINVQNGNDFQMWTAIESDSAKVGSFSQFGPSSPVNLKIKVLITPHSGLSMKRIDRMVGIEGTAQGSTNSTASTFTHQRFWAKNPERNSAIIILMLMATIRNTSVLTTVRRKIGSSASST